MKKLDFRLYEKEFFTKQASPPPLRDFSNRTMSQPFISSSLLKTVLSSLVLLNPITLASVSLAMQRISSILNRGNTFNASLLISGRLKLINPLLSRKTTAVERKKFPQHITSFQFVGPWFKFISHSGNVINLKYEPYLFK